MTYFNEIYLYESTIQWGRLEKRMGGTINSHRIFVGEPDGMPIWKTAKEM